jgi:hypothetical protein
LCHLMRHLAVSVGASDDYNDGQGSLKATAVLFLTGTHDSTLTGNIPIKTPYIPTRVDFLAYKLPYQSRDTLTDFQLTLFSDDGTTAHNPYQQVRATAYVLKLGANGWYVQYSPVRLGRLL